MLIIASRKPLEVCGAEQQLNSAFFNMAQLCELKEFSDEEAEELLLLPSPLAPALEPEERKLAQRWGGKMPWQLQLAALFLFDARRDGKSTAWAKKKFDKERSRRMQMPEQPRFLSVPPWLRAVFWDFPRWLGSLIPWLGRIFGDTASFINGWLLILLIIACVFKYAGVADVFAYARKLAGL
jgi:hypothetical protein